jgi:hypothetical protein
VDRGDALFMRAVAATIEIASRLNAVTDDFATTVLALGGQGVDRAFETIKIMRNAGDNDFQRFVVVVAADFALVNLAHKINPVVRVVKVDAVEAR